MTLSSTFAAGRFSGLGGAALAGLLVIAGLAGCEQASAPADAGDVSDTETVPAVDVEAAETVPATEVEAVEEG